MTSASLDGLKRKALGAALLALIIMAAVRDAVVKARRQRQKRREG